MELLTLGSLFDGIGGWLLAALHNGVKPVWASEIDEFPAAVTAHHFPEVKQLGDITKIDPDKLEPVDIICAGSPCQDLSVAGKRAGLEGERSGLFHTAIRLVHELRARTGSPRYFVWENVPGAFSSNKGHDFRAVLEEISQTEIPMPKDNKWAESGMVEWDSGSLAWRTLDAQYLGVPQRRKRIFLVADLAGQSAGEILFERKSLYGHTSESEGEREGTAANAGASTESTGWDAYQHHNWRYADKLGPLTTGSCDRVRGDTPLVSGGFKYRNGAHGHEPCVCIAGNIIDRQVQNGGNGVGAQKDISYTLNTIDRHAVCYSFDSKASNSMKSSNPHSGCREVEVSKCLDTTTPDPSKNQGGVAIVGYRASGFQGYSEDSVAGTLRAQGGTLGEGSETFVTQKTVGCLNADDYKGINNQYVSQGKLVVDNGRNVR